MAKRQSSTRRSELISSQEILKWMVLSRKSQSIKTTNVSSFKRSECTTQTESINSIFEFDIHMSTNLLSTIIHLRSSITGRKWFLLMGKNESFTSIIIETMRLIRMDWSIDEKSLGQRRLKSTNEERIDWSIDLLSLRRNLKMMRRIRKRTSICNYSRTITSRLQSSIEWSNDMNLIQRSQKRSKSEKLSLTFRKELSTSTITTVKARSWLERSNSKELIWLERDELMMVTMNEMLLKMQRARSIRSFIRWRLIAKLMSRTKRNRLTRKLEETELILKEQLLNADWILMTSQMCSKRCLKRVFMIKLSIRPRTRRRIKTKKMKVTK